jgi:Holliday junction resolvase
MPTNSAKKGKAGERELSRRLHELGYAARRAEQRRGDLPDAAPDVVTDLDEHLYFDAKRTKRTKPMLWHARVEDWIEKIAEECNMSDFNQDWCIAWRPNHCPDWLFIVEDEEAGWKLLRGAENLLEVYDPDRSNASLEGRSGEDVRFDVQFSPWKF